MIKQKYDQNLMRHEENDLRKSCMLWSVLVSITQQKKVMINCLVSENIILSTLNTFFYLVVEPLKCRGGGVYLDLSDSTIKKSIFMCAFPYHFHLDFLHVYFYLIKHWESSELLCVPRKGFESAVCDTIHFSVHKQLIWTFFEAHIVSNEELKIHRMSVCVKITLIHLQSTCVWVFNFLLTRNTWAFPENFLKNKYNRENWSLGILHLQES